MANGKWQTLNRKWKARLGGSAAVRGCDCPFTFAISHLPFAIQAKPD
jgi:hypothetical protein